jgi:hypothetical protein
LLAAIYFKLSLFQRHHAREKVFGGDQNRLRMGS